MKTTKNRQGPHYRSWRRSPCCFAVFAFLPVVVQQDREPFGLVNPGGVIFAPFHECSARRAYLVRPVGRIAAGSADIFIRPKKVGALNPAGRCFGHLLYAAECREPDFLFPCAIDGKAAFRADTALHSGSASWTVHSNTSDQKGIVCD